MMNNRAHQDSPGEAAVLWYACLIVPPGKAAGVPAACCNALEMWRWYYN
ncbi:MAG: hypothetical protein M3O22_03180 [Pseudomonadota bacterium]|nr:hypothetical protein [Pseudomonadota bacterium]